MSPPDLLPTNPLSLSQQLRSRVDHRLATILRANYNTQFAQAASELAAFRDAITGVADDMDDATLCDIFRNTVQLTTYDAYAPLVSKLFKKPCRESEVANLLSPGLPDYIVRSSSTSGGVSKLFPKYNCLPKVDMSAMNRSMAAGTPDPVPKRTIACIFSFLYDSLDITDEDDRFVKTVNITFTASSVHWRSVLGLHPDNDGERMSAFLLCFAVPYAARFIKKWRSFLIIHGLFALGSRYLEFIRMSFVTTFIELVQYIDADFDTILDCIENGTIPELEGIVEVRRHLESAMSPDPERAAELRNIGRPSSRPGWCSLAWPNLHSVRCTASGAFASSLPLAQSFLGPNVKIMARGYGSAECRIGTPYDLHNLEHYKLNNGVTIEFLDFSQGDSLGSITQQCEVKFGRRYEVVVTTVNGLWRYRLGDVVEIVGFDPADGTPVIRFIERRGAVIRFAHFTITEKELRSAMSLVAESTLGNVVDWTATIDEWQIPRTIGLFVELANEGVPDLSGVGERILDALSRTNKMISHAFAKGSLGKPIIRIVKRGAFSAFRQLKLDEGGNNLGQVKVPVVLPKPDYVTWFLNQVVKEV